MRLARQTASFRVGSFRKNMASSVFQRAAICGAIACLMSWAPVKAVRADEAQEVSKLIQSNQLDAALQRVEASLLQKPRDAQMRFFKGLILTEQGKTSDAIAVFQRLTEDYPELPEPYNNLAVLYAAQGDYEKARASLEMAIRTHPSYATAHENLGDVYAKLASEAYDKALQLDSTNTAAQSKLALIKELISVNGAPTKKPGATPAAGATSNASPAKPNTPNAPNATANSAVSTKPAQAPQIASAAPAPAPAPAPAVTPAQAPPTSVSASPPKPVTPPPVVAAAAPTPTPAPAPTPASVAPAPAAKPTPPAPATAGDTGSTAEKSAVSDAVNSWAQAWASKDIAGYLSAYSKDFATPGGQSRDQWEEDRKARILGKSSISIKLDDMEITIQGDKATARFRQDYHADHLSANSRKTLTLIHSQGKWLIQQERTGA
jgi:Flp pilus assembly protein TadD/ketosteroid isomerase-like protein